MEKTHKPKVAMIVNLLPDKNHHGGVAYQVHKIAQKLSEEYDITVFAMNKTNLNHVFKNIPITIPRILENFRFFQLTLFPLYVRLQNFRKFDLIHAHGDDYLFFFVDKPILRTFYGSAFGEFKTASSVQRKIHQFLRYFTEFISGFHAKINVSISFSTKKYLPFIDRVIPCGIDLQKFKPSDEKSENPSILFVGTVKGRKRGWFLSRIFREKIKPKIPNAELWIVSGEKVKGEGIKWFGRIPEDKLIDLYQKAWVFCLPSKYEGFGVPYIESMACGTPVVASPNPGAKEVLCDGEYGPIVEDEMLGNTLITMLKNSEMRERYAQRGLGYIQKFDWKNVVHEYQQLYNKFIN